MLGNTVCLDFTGLHKKGVYAYRILSNTSNRSPSPIEAPPPFFILNNVKISNLFFTPAGHRILNLLSCLFGLRSFAAFTFYKVCFLGVPYKIYSINIVDSTHYSVVLSVTGTRFL